MDLGLTNATAVVVGGGRGMGLASARCLADDGARVAIIARSRADLDSATDDLTHRGSPDAVGLAADAGDGGVGAYGCHGDYQTIAHRQRPAATPMAKSTSARRKL